MQHNYRNNVIVDLASAVAAGVTTVNVDPVTQALLPDGVQTTLATLEEIDANGVITLRECIEITNRSGGALTVVRADQLVPASDAATTQTQISYPFDPSNGARVGLYVTKKAFEQIEQDIKDLQDATTGDFVTEIALIDNVDRYAASVTGTDAYEILIDTLDQAAVPVYQGLVDGQKFDVDFDVINTGGATLTINNSLATFGPKALTKLNGQPLASGDVTAGLKTVVMYDAGDDHWRIVGTLGDYAASVTVADTKHDFILGEDFASAGPREGAAFIGKGQTQVEGLVSNGAQIFGDVAASEKVRLHIDNTVDTQSFNLWDFSFYIDIVGAPADDIDFEIFEGAVAVSSDLVLNQTIINGTQQIHATGRAWFTSTLSEKYIEVRRSGALDAANHYSIQRHNVTAPAGVTYDVYNTGVWTLAAGSLQFTTTFGFEKDKVYKTDPRGIEAEDMRAKAIVTGLAGETHAFYTGGIINHVAANVNLEYKEHLLVDKIIDDISIFNNSVEIGGSANAFFSQGGVGTNESGGQTYTMTKDYLFQFDVQLYRTGTPGDTIFARAYDVPGGTLLATSINSVNGTDLNVYSAIFPQPVRSFVFENLFIGTGNPVYIDFYRSGPRDIVNYYQSVFGGGYGGGTNIFMNSGVGTPGVNDLLFRAFESNVYNKATGLYDIDKGQATVNFGSGFYVGNQIENGFFSLEVMEEQNEKRIKQTDLQSGSAFGVGVGGITIAHNLGVPPRMIQAVFTPQNLQTNQASAGSSNGTRSEGVQGCVYSFGDGSTGTQFESGVSGSQVGVLHASRIAGLTNIEITNVDKDNITLAITVAPFSGFYHLTLFR